MLQKINANVRISVSLLNSKLQDCKQTTLSLCEVEDFYLLGVTQATEQTRITDPKDYLALNSNQFISPLGKVDNKLAQMGISPYATICFKPVDPDLLEQTNPPVEQDKPA